MTAREPASSLSAVSGILFLLAIGTFAVGTDAFVLSGLLPAMAADLHTSMATMGQLVTIFAIAYAISAPLVAALTAGWSRRRLLMTAQIVFVIGMLLQAWGSGAEVLGAGRVVAAIGAAGFTSAAAAVAGALVAPTLRGRALAVVLGGTTVATILGVPLGIFVGKWFGWRITLAGVGGLGVIAAIGTLAVPLLKVPVAPLSVRIAALRRPGALVILLTTVAVMAGSFSMYTYLATLVSPVVSAAMIGWMFLVFGCSGALGNMIAGRWTDRIGPLPVLRLGIILVGVVAFLMPVLRQNVYTMWLAVIIWPIGGWLTAVPQQYRFLGLGQDVAPVLIGWNASGTYAGIALGAVLGGFALTSGSASWIGPIGGTSAVVALLLTTIAIPKPPTK